MTLNNIRPDETIFVAGHRGLVGSAILRELKRVGHDKIIVKSRTELDLLNQDSVNRFFQTETIDHVICAAAKVGGILANSRDQVGFLYENTMISFNLIRAAAERENLKKFLFLGSSCIYPKDSAQPIREEYLLSGPLEPTNQGYAIAKIAALKLCEMYNRQFGREFISAMPTNLYGPKDNFHPENSHVLPAMLRRFHEAKVAGNEKVVVWGTGTPKREFLHVDDLAEAAVFLLDHYSGPETINLGSGHEISIMELATTIKNVVGFQGAIEFDLSKPDGTPRKLVDVTKIRELGWSPRIHLKDGIRSTYQWAQENNVF